MEEFEYNNYSKARDASWCALTENNVHRLPVDVFKLAQNMGIEVASYGDGKRLLRLMRLTRLTGKNDGLYVRFMGKGYIFYDDTVASEGRIRFTIAHEIGHHILRHINANLFFLPRCAERGKSNAASAREREANIFAARLLAPSIVLRELGISSPEDISKICGISLEAATYRANRLKILRERNLYGISGLEKRMLDNFREYIEENRL